MLRKVFALLISALISATPLFAASTDTVFDTDTKLMLHMDGADASTTFTDSSTSGKSVNSIDGNAQIDTSQYKFGGASGLFDGNGDYITYSDSDDFSFVGTDVTIDCWIRPAAVVELSYYSIFGQESSDFYPSNFADIVGTGGFVRWIVRKESGGNGDVISLQTTGVTFSANTTYHLAFVKSGNNYYIFVDGTMRASGTSATAVENIAEVLSIGTRNTTLGQTFNGWIDEFRFVKGTAVWTEDFTPPTAAYSAPGGARRIITVT